MALSKKMKLIQMTQTAQRSQAFFVEDVKQEPGKPNRPGKMVTYVTDDPKDLAGLALDKVFTITFA